MKIMEETTLENVSVNENDTTEEKIITKKERISYLLMGLIWFAALPLSLLGTLFKPLYKKVFYGQANGYFKYGLGIVLLLIFFFVIVFAIEKKFDLKYKKDVKPMPWWKTCAIFFGAFLLTFFISAIIGFNLKPFYDVGNNTTAYMAGISFTKLAYFSVELFFAMKMIENFQYALDDILPFKNKAAKYIPYGGLLTMLTYGMFGLIIGVGGTLSVLYFFLILLYGELYLLVDRSILKAYATSLLIFVL